MLEGIHGLNPRLLAQIGKDEAFRVFICPLAQLTFDRVTRMHASDMRLIRRIVRDRHSHGYSAAASITRWDSVRAGERKHIFPFQHHADAVFDSVAHLRGCGAQGVRRAIPARGATRQRSLADGATVAEPRRLLRSALPRSRATDLDSTRVHRRQRVSILSPYGTRVRGDYE